MASLFGPMDDWPNFFVCLSMGFSDPLEFYIEILRGHLRMVKVIPLEYLCFLCFFVCFLKKLNVLRENGVLSVSFVCHSVSSL